jgi:hypothetical protein
VEVKSASKKDTPFPLAELIGKQSSNAPTKITAKKPSNMICVVDNLIFFRFIVSFTFSSRGFFLRLEFSFLTPSALQPISE